MEILTKFLPSFRLTLFLLALPVFGFAQQFPVNSQKIVQGTGTTAQGITSYSSAPPSVNPTSATWRHVTSIHMDTAAQINYLYKRPRWYPISTVRRSTPPPATSTSGGVTIDYTESLWQNTVDSLTYYYEEENGCWQPIGTYISSTTPVDVSATGTTGGICYGYGLWYDPDVDSIYAQQGSTWTAIGAGAQTNTAASFTMTVTQAGHGFSLLDPVCLGATWRLANVTDEDSLHIAIVSQVVSSSVFRVQFAGKVYAPGHGYTLGKPYFVQNDGSFALTVESGKINDLAFTPLTTDSLLIHEQRPVNAATDQNGIYTGSGYVPSGTVAYVDNFEVRDSASTYGVEIDPENGNLAMFGDSLRLVFQSGSGLKLTDSNASKRGLEYAASGYVTQPRSLADKAYVDAAVAAASVADGDKGDITVSSSGSVWNIDADAVGSAEIATGAVTTTEILDGTIQTGDLAFTPNGGSGTANQIAYWTATNTLSSDSDFRFDGSTVGIGVAPSANNKVFIQGTNNAATDFGLVVENLSGADILQVRNEGTVGINNATIVESLSVRGGLYVTSTGGTQYFRMRQADGHTVFGSSTPSSTYRVQIIGSGATSSTYGFRVTNSGGSVNCLTVRDDNTAGIGVDASGNAFLSLGATISTKASLNIPEGTAPSSPTVGDMWNNSATNGLQYSQSGATTSLSGTIFTGTASANTNNTSTEVSITPSGVGTLTLPANFLTAGKTVRVRVAGSYTTHSGSQTILLRFKLGSTSVVATSATNLAGSSTGFWEAEFLVTCRTAGVSGTTASFGDIEFNSAEATRDATVKITGTPTIDTTASQAITITAQWGAADVNNSITTTMLTAETIN